MSKKLLLVLAVVAIAIAASGCKTLKGKVGGKVSAKVDTDVDASDIKKAAKGSAELKKKAEECEKLRDPLIAIEEEVAIGQVIALNFFKDNGGLLLGDENSPEGKMTKYVNVVGKNLAAQSDRPTLEWTFGVLDSDGYNAFSAPGGYVLVTKGLLKTLDNEAQLAGVLGHEIAHITERHALRLYAAIKANQCQTVILGGAAGDLAAHFVKFEAAVATPGGFIDLNDVANTDILLMLADKIVEKITTQGYAHEDEYTSDRVASELAAGAGYDPRPLTGVIAKIPVDGGAFAHHPSNDDRVAKLKEWAKAQKKAAKGNPFVTDPTSRDLKKPSVSGKLTAAKK